MVASDIMAVMDDQTLPMILKPYGITSLEAFNAKAKLTNQQAWNLWRGYHGVGPKYALLLAPLLGVPIEELLRAKAAPKYRHRSQTRQPA